MVLPYINMHLPQVYMCSPFWTLLPPPSPYHPSGSSQCTSPKHPVSCIEPGLVTRFIYDIIHVFIRGETERNWHKYTLGVDHVWGRDSRWCCGKEPTCQCRRHKKCRFNPWLGKILWTKKWQPTPVILPGKFHGQRSLAGYSPGSWRVGHNWPHNSLIWTWNVCGQKKNWIYI